MSSSLKRGRPYKNWRVRTQHEQHDVRGEPSVEAYWARATYAYVLRLTHGRSDGAISTVRWVLASGIPSGRASQPPMVCGTAHLQVRGSTVFLHAIRRNDSPMLTSRNSAIHFSYESLQTHATKILRPPPKVREVHVAIINFNTPKY